MLFVFSVQALLSLPAPSLSQPSGVAALLLIFASELGDKTFFIAALLAMQKSKMLVFIGSAAALSVRQQDPDVLLLSFMPCGVLQTLGIQL